MAASLVTTGALEGDAFRAAHGEIFATFGKIQPFLDEMRKASNEPDLSKHMREVVMAAPDAEPSGSDSVANQNSPVSRLQ